MSDRVASRASGARAEGRPSLRLVAASRARDPAVVLRRNLALLLLPTGALTLIGIVMVFSASTVTGISECGSSFCYLGRQAIYAVVGVGALVVCARLPYKAWRRLAGPALGLSVVLLILALHPASGSSVYGASRWLQLGPVTIQPSELAKFSLIAFAAAILTKKWRHLDDPIHLVVPLVPVVLFVAGIVILQRDLGTTIILCGSVFLLVFTAGVRLRYLILTSFAGLAISAALILGEGYRRVRVLSFRNPFADPTGAGYQLIQGYIALGSGGWTGVGLGASRQKWAYVPNAHTDFIFAILGEELGLLGALVVLVLFGVLIYAGIRIAVRAPDTFGRLLAAGITSWIGLQTIVNLGAVTGLLPITGVPLPFVSYGGTSLVVTLAAIGVLSNVARGSAAYERRRLER